MSSAIFNINLETVEPDWAVHYEAKKQFIKELFKDNHEYDFFHFLKFEKQDRNIICII